MYFVISHSFMNSTMVGVIAVVTFAAAIVGALLARAMFKKHFRKAGIV